MRAFDFYLLGFVEFEVDASDFTEAIALFLRNGIRIRSQCQSRLTVFRHQKSDAFKLLSERNIKYNITRKFAVFDSAADKAERLEEAKVGLCMECGCCSYVCPAARPLVEYNKLGKALLRSMPKKN